MDLSMKVLIVDDFATMRRILKNIPEADWFFKYSRG